MAQNNEVGDQVTFISYDYFFVCSFQELLALFKTIDSDGSGSLSLLEVILHLKSITDDISEEENVKVANQNQKYSTPSLTLVLSDLEELMDNIMADEHESN